MISKIRQTRIAARFLIGAATIAVICVPSTFRAAQSETPGTSAGPQRLDYEFFKTRVEPIYLKMRSEAHARCITCHVKNKHPRGLSLEPLLPGNTEWTEEQSCRNFQTVTKLVVPGHVDTSMFPMHPLAPEAGGDALHPHSGGRQFESQNDPDFQTIVEWINGQKEGSSSAP